MNFRKTVEVMYYLKKYDFQGVIYFDTFPKREKAVEECEANIKMCRRIEQLIDAMDSAGWRRWWNRTMR